MELSQWTQYAWPAAAAVFALIALGATVALVRKVQGYFRWSSRTAAKVHSIEVVAKGVGYGVRVTYSFKVDGWEYDGKDWLKTAYESEQAAKGGAQALEAVTPTVYYEAGKPSRSGLRRRFPFKGVLISFAVALVTAALAVLCLMQWPAVHR